MRIKEQLFLLKALIF